MTDTKVLVKKRFATAAAWHSWLEKHHAGSQGLWLEFAKKENERPSSSRRQASSKWKLQRATDAGLPRTHPRVKSSYPMI